MDYVRDLLAHPREDTSDLLDFGLANLVERELSRSEQGLASAIWVDLVLIPSTVLGATRGTDRIDP